MKLSEARHQHLVIDGNVVAGFNFVVKKIAAGEPIEEIRLLTEEAVHENLMAASRDLRNRRINLQNGPVISPVSPGKNDGEIVEIDIDQEQAKQILAELR